MRTKVIIKICWCLYIKSPQKCLKFSLIILMAMSDCWEALFLSNLTMSFFMSSVLTFEKRNVSFLKVLCIASMLGWYLHLKIVLRVRSAMFSVTRPNLLYLKTFRLILYLKKNYLDFHWFLTQFLRFHPFYLYWLLTYLLCVICLKVNVSLISRTVCYQLRFLYLSFHSTLS